MAEPGTEAAGPAPAADERTGRALEALLKLNRAVQRATVYPDGHPSVATAIALMHRSLCATVERDGALALGVTSSGFVIADRPVQNAEVLDWLARRLYEQGVGAVTFTPGVDEGDLAAFVAWLARKAGTPEPPPLRFIKVMLIDYGRARFEEQRREAAEEESDPLLVWRSLLDGLTAGWYQGDNTALPDDPAACAAELCAEVARNEGLGAASFVAGIVGAGSRLPQIGEPSRQVVRARLASFIAALTPELRGQLLHVDPSASARKLDFLADIADALPDTTLMEAITDLDGRGGRVSDSFIGLLNRLTSLSVRDPSLRELTETKLVSLGLPRGLSLMEPVHVRSMLEHALCEGRDADFVPADHQTTLERLSGGAPMTVQPWSRYHDHVGPEALSAHVAAIVLRLLVALPDHPDAPAYLKRLTDEAPHALAAGRFAELYETASSLRDLLVLRHYVASDVPQLVEAYLAFLRLPATIQAVLAAIEGAADGLPDGVTGLLRLAAPEATVAALERLAALPIGAPRQHVMDALAQLKPELFAEAVTRARAKGGAALEGLFVVLEHPEMPGRIDYAQTFIGNRDPAIRLRALSLLLDADQRPGQHERYLQRALGDSAPAVRDFAIEAARHAPDARTISALRSFLLSRGAATDAPARLRAVSVLASFTVPEGPAALIDLLRRRRFSVRLREVRPCVAAAAALSALEDPAARAAAAAWRRSPSGWTAWLFSHPDSEQEEQA